MNILIVGSGMSVSKTMIVALIMTDMHLSVCESKQMNQFEEPTSFKIERTHLPENEFDYSSIKKHELHKLHPFNKFMETKKNW